MKFDELKNKIVVILGFGVEGQATFNFLRKKFPEMIIGIADKREEEEFSKKFIDELEKDEFTQLHLGSTYMNCLEPYDVVIKSPGISIRHPQLEHIKQRGVFFTSQTNLFFSNTIGTIVGITGSKGKSTTSSLLHDILKTENKNVRLIGNIGNPPLGYLNEETKDFLYVYELSSYQLEDLQTPPHVGVMINFFPDHLDYHEGIENYFDAKFNMAKLMSEKETFIFNQSSKKVVEHLNEIKAKTISFNNNSSSKIENDYLIHDEEKIINVKDVSLIGEHNLKNCLAAISVAKLFDISTKNIQKGIKNFKPLEHRLEKVGTFNEITFYNDAISTTPESTIAALNSLKDVSTLILGGHDRGYNFKALAKLILEENIKNILLFPSSGKVIWEEIETLAQNKNLKLPYHAFVKNMEECVKIAYEKTDSQNICLLSTASPSYGIFKNFIDKGNQFKKEILKLK